jgi:DNA-binding CsgD family transcriptional regulator
MKVANKTIIVYGLTLGLVLIILKTIEYKWLVRDIGQQLYVFIIALFFMVLGIWLSFKLFPDKRLNEKPEVNVKAIKQLGLSSRELEVLAKLEQGLTNQQIADSLFVSVNTVKTHLKNGFVKLEVSNRTEAVNKLKSLNIIT